LIVCGVQLQKGEEIILHVNGQSFDMQVVYCKNDRARGNGQLFLLGLKFKASFAGPHLCDLVKKFEQDPPLHSS